MKNKNRYLAMFLISMISFSVIAKDSTTNESCIKFGDIKLGMTVNTQFMSNASINGYKAITTEMLLKTNDDNEINDAKNNPNEYVKNTFGAIYNAMSTHTNEYNAVTNRLKTAEDIITISSNDIGIINAALTTHSNEYTTAINRLQGLEQNASTNSGSHWSKYPAKETVNLNANAISLGVNTNQFFITTADKETHNDKLSIYANSTEAITVTREKNIEDDFKILGYSIESESATDGNSSYKFKVWVPAFIQTPEIYYLNDDFKWVQLTWTHTNNSDNTTYDIPANCITYDIILPDGTLTESQYKILTVGGTYDKDAAQKNNINIHAKTIFENDIILSNNGTKYQLIINDSDDENPTLSIMKISE